MGWYMRFWDSGAHSQIHKFRLVNIILNGRSVASILWQLPRFSPREKIQYSTLMGNGDDKNIQKPVIIFRIHIHMICFPLYLRFKFEGVNVDCV